MKPGVLFELKNIGKPLAWFQIILFTYRIKSQVPPGPLEGAVWKNCLIWKPELFEPRKRNRD